MVEIDLAAQTTNNGKIKSLKRGLLKAWNGITVEPVLVLFTLPFYMSALAIQNLSLEKACRVNLNLNTSICDAIAQRNQSGFTEADEIATQKIVAAASVWKNVIAGVFPAILLPLFGSWSDRNKIRSVLVVMPIIGEIVTNIGFILCTFFYYELPMEVNTVIEVLPTAVTGGFNMVSLGIFICISTNSSAEDRIFRMGIVQTLFNICVTVGNAVSGVMYALIGFYGVFSLSLVMYTLGALYGYYATEDGVTDDLKSLTKWELVTDIVSVKKTVSSFKFIKKSSSNSESLQVGATLFSEVLTIGPVVGQGAVLYLYTRLLFNWDEIDFSIFNGYFSVAHLVGNFGSIVVFSKWLKFDDAMLGVISTVSKIAGGIAYVFAITPLSFYLCTLFDAVNGAAVVATRAIASKLVSENDLGKVISLFGIVGSLAGLIYGPLYSAVYEATIDVFPAAIYMVGVGLSIPAVLIFVWLYIRRDVRLPKDS